MAINFPNSPTPNQIYTFNGLSWRWTGSSWTSLGTAVIGATGATGTTGATGAQGPQGNTGATGATGATGTNGTNGTNGATGATGATGPVGDYVISLMGLTGAVGLTNGSGIGLSVSGNTLTFSNTGVLSFNGLTGAVTGVTTGTANTFGPLQSFSSGISSAGGTFSDLTRLNAGLSASFVRTPSIQGPGGTDVIFDSGAIKLQQLGFPSNNTTRLTASSTVDQTITLPDDTGTIALTKNVVSSFNGLTGSITGVSSVRGLTGAVGITNGSGIGLSVSGQTMTFSNTGVLSINGSTGTITNVAKTNEVTNFSAASNLLTVTDTTSLRSISIRPGDKKIVFTDNDFGNDVQLFVSNFGNQVITFPDSTTTLAGLSETQTFTSTNTFYALTNFDSGISASGATFSGNISAPNIVNRINGLTGNVNFVAGTNITITPGGNTLTIASSGGGGGVDAAFVIAMATVL